VYFIIVFSTIFSEKHWKNN